MLMSCIVEVTDNIYLDLLDKYADPNKALKEYLEIRLGEKTYSPNQSVFAEIIKAKSIRLNKAKDRLRQVKNNIKQAVKKNQKADSLRKTRDRLEKRIEGLEKELQILEIGDSISDMEQVFQQDKEYLEVLLTSNDPRDLFNATGIINMYEKMGDFSDMTSTTHPLFDKETLSRLDTEGNVVKTLQDWSNQMDFKKSAITQKFKTTVENVVGNTNRYKNEENLEYDEIVKAMKDLNIFDSLTMSLGQGGLFGNESKVAKAIMDTILEDRKNASLEIGKKWEEHDTLFKKFKSAVNDKKDIYKLFKQFNKGKFTGRLTSRFTQDYYNDRRREFSKIDKKIEKELLKTNSKSLSKLYKAREQWRKENELFFDIRKLPEIKAKFPKQFGYIEDTTHKQEIIDLIGEKGYKEQIDRQIIKIERYLREEEFAKEQAENTEEFRIWQRVNSPFFGAAYWYNENVEDLKYSGKFLNEYNLKDKKASYRGQQHLVRIPKSEKYYDANFKAIEANEDIHNYYKFLESTLADIRANLPIEVRNKFETMYDIPAYEKSFLEAVMDNSSTNYGKALKNNLYDGIINSIGDNQESEIAKENDPFNTEREGINYNFIGSRVERVNALYNIKIAEYQDKYDSTPDYQTLQNLKAEAEEDIANNSSFDLGKVIKTFIYQSTHAKFRETSLPKLEILKDAATKIPKVRKNNAGGIIRDEGNPTTDGLRVNELTQIENALRIHKMIPTQKKELVSDKKIYTSEEKIEKEKIEKLLESDKLSDSQKEGLNKQLDKLGKVVTGSAIGDTLLKYLRWLGLGWNVSAMFPNAAAGYFANFIEAADGRFFSNKAMIKAYKELKHSTVKLVTFGKKQSTTAKKINNLINRTDILLDATNEFQKAQLGSGVTGKLDFLDPMLPNKVVEYPNQGAIAIARLETIKIVDEEGNESSLWEALDENLELLPQFQTEENLKNWTFESDSFQSEIRAVKEMIKKVHGDYSEEGRMKAKNNILGRMMSFFKTWMARTIVNRFGAETDTTDLGTQKGRYRSYTKGTSAVAGSVIGTMFMPGIGTVVGGSIGTVAGMLYGSKSEENFIQEYFGTIKQLTRRAVFSKMAWFGYDKGKLSSQFNDKFNEVDAANMRANIQELQHLLTALGTFLLAKGLLYDDDEDKKDQYLHNFVINQINRSISDLLFFTNPNSPQTVIDQAFPLARLIDNSTRVFTSGLKIMFGEEIQGNENTFVENISKNLPAMMRPLLGEPPVSKAQLEKDFGTNHFWKQIFE